MKQLKNTFVITWGTTVEHCFSTPSTFFLFKKRLLSIKIMFTEPVGVFIWIEPVLHAYLCELWWNRWSLLKGRKMPDGKAEQGCIQHASQASASLITSHIWEVACKWPRFVFQMHVTKFTCTVQWSVCGNGNLRCTLAMQKENNK